MKTKRMISGQSWMFVMIAAMETDKPKEAAAVADDTATTAASKPDVPQVWNTLKNCLSVCKS